VTGRARKVNPVTSAKHVGSRLRLENVTAKALIQNSAIETAKYAKHAKEKEVAQDRLFTRWVKKLLQGECYFLPILFAWFAWFAVHPNCGF
jgi:hypothetical protein